MESKLEAETIKVITRVNKLVQLGSGNRHALNKTEVQNAFQDSLTPEAPCALKVAGFSLALLSPACMTIDLWQMIMDTVVKEMAGTHNTPVLLIAIPLLKVVPTTLVLSFLKDNEQEPLNKIKKCTAHESLEVRRVTLITFSRISISCATILFHRGLYRFNFDSNESRVCAQQDVYSIITDIWKINLSVAEVELDDAAGAAFTCLTHLFLRHSHVKSIIKHEYISDGGIDELVTFVFNNAFPRFYYLKTNAQKLNMENQLDAMQLLSIVALMMMQRSGAQQPGISVPLLEIDFEKYDEGDKSSTTIKTRADHIATELIDFWLLPAYTNSSLTQARAISNGVLIVMHHPLQYFHRFRWASIVLTRLIAAIYSSTIQEAKYESILHLVSFLNFANSYDFLNSITATIESIATLPLYETRLELYSNVWHHMVMRLVYQKQFKLFQAICNCDFFSSTHQVSNPQQTSSPIEVFHSLIQAACCSSRTTKYKGYHKNPIDLHMSFLQIQYILCRQFHPILLSKTNNDTKQKIMVLYTSICSQFCQNLFEMLSESFPKHHDNNGNTTALKLEQIKRDALQFLGNDVEPILSKVIYQNVRVQYMWLCIRYVHSNTKSNQYLQLITQELNLIKSYKDGKTGSSATYDDGLLGGGETGMNDLNVNMVSYILALMLCLKALLYQDFTLKQKIIDLLQDTQSKHTQHDIILHHITTTLNGIINMQNTSSHTLNEVQSYGAFILNDIFHPKRLFHTSKSSVDILSKPNDIVQWQDPSEVTVTGPSDPLCIKISIREFDTLNIISVVVTCYNVTNVNISDFNISISSNGPMKLVDTSRSMQFRSIGDLVPRGSFQSEKMFQCTRFACSKFYVRVSYDLNPAEKPPTVMGFADPYTVPLHAFLKNIQQKVSGDQFYKEWNSAEISQNIRVIQNVILETTSSQTVYDLILQNCCTKVNIVHELNVCHSHFFQIAFNLETKWSNTICMILSCYLTSNHASNWQGTLNIRGSTLICDELLKMKQQLISLLFHTVLGINTTPIVKVIASEALVTNIGSLTIVTNGVNGINALNGIKPQSPRFQQKPRSQSTVYDLSKDQIRDTTPTKKGLWNYVTKPFNF